MNKSSVVIIPLRCTNSPAGELVLLEALCLGKPVVITQTPITEVYVKNQENGLLVPERDADAVVNALDYIFSDYKRAVKMGLKGKEIVLRKFSYDVLAKNIANIINKDLDNYFNHGINYQK